MFWLNFPQRKSNVLNWETQVLHFVRVISYKHLGTAANNVALEFFITFGISEMVKLSFNTIDVAPMLQGSSKPVPRYMSNLILQREATCHLKSKNTSQNA